MRYALAVGLAFMAAPAFAAGPAVDTAVTNKCELYGYTTDKDAKGTNVRASASATAPVVGHLPPEQASPGNEESFAPEFTITGAKNGWFLIKDAKTGQYGDGPEKTVFAGPGWISGGLIGFTIGSTALRATPSTSGKLVAKLMDTDKGYGPDSYAVKRVHDCKPGWVELTIRLAPSLDPKSKPMRGWVRHVCGTQVTTCDAGGED